MCHLRNRLAAFPANEPRPMQGKTGRVVWRPTLYAAPTGPPTLCYIQDVGTEFYFIITIWPVSEISVLRNADKRREREWLQIPSKSDSGVLMLHKVNDALKLCKYREKSPNYEIYGLRCRIINVPVPSLIWSIFLAPRFSIRLSLCKQASITFSFCTEHFAFELEDYAKPGLIWVSQKSGISANTRFPIARFALEIPSQINIHMTSTS